MPNVFESVTLDPKTGDPGVPETGQHWYNNTLGEPRVRRGSSSETILTPPSHLSLDTLAHGLVETAEVVDTFDAEGCITARTWRQPGGGVNIRVVDNFTFDAEGCLTGLRVRQLDGTGSVVETLTISKTGSVWNQVAS